MRRLLLTLICASALAGGARATPSTHVLESDKTTSSDEIARLTACRQLFTDFIALRKSLHEESSYARPSFAEGLLKAESPWQLAIYLVFSKGGSSAGPLGPAPHHELRITTAPEGRLAPLLARDVILGCSGFRLKVTPK